VVLVAAAQMSEARGQGQTCGRPEVAAVVDASVRAAAGAETVQARVMTCDVTADAAIDAAVIEPGARFGRPVRFRLMGGGRQRGSAVAVVAGEIRQVQAARAVSSNTTLVAEDLATTSAEATGQLIEPLPGLEEIIGAQTVRDLAAGEIVTSRVARIEPAVRSGDRVVVRAAIGAVQVTGTATAQQTGKIGDVIRVINTDSRRALRARVTGKGEVEVVYGS
jgi:flagella basal body P-ring formation protein FlgA